MPIARAGTGARYGKTATGIIERRMTAITPSDSPASPCVRNCCLDEANVCLGCGRSLDEIVAWTRSSDVEKRAVLDRSRARVAERERRIAAWTKPR
jgi:predicted Fe-S protein YdhL (DUF1289 family)